MCMPWSLLNGLRGILFNAFFVLCKVVRCIVSKFGCCDNINSNIALMPRAFSKKCFKVVSIKRCYVVRPRKTWTLPNANIPCNASLTSIGQIEESLSLQRQIPGTKFQQRRRTLLYEVYAPCKRWISSGCRSRTQLRKVQRNHPRLFSSFRPCRT